jgi:hypothetical protein
MDKLDYSKWEKKERDYIESLIRILSDESRTDIASLIDLLRSAPTGLGDSEHIEQPALFALLAFGEAGLKELHTFMIQKNWSPGAFYAPIAIMAVALGRHDVADMHIYLAKRYLSEKAFSALTRDIHNTINSVLLKTLAIQLLAVAAQVLATESDKRSNLTSIFTSISLMFDLKGQQGNPAIDLFLKLIIQGSLNVNELMCEEFRKLVDQDLNEQVYQEFLSSHPALIDPLASTIVDRQTLGEMWRSDFVIRRLDNEYVFVELEKPRDNPFTPYPQPSVVLSHSIGQVLNWFIWAEDNIAYAHSHGFPGILNPRGIIVIGRRKDLIPSQVRMLSSLNELLYPRIQIITYDDVLQSALSVLNNLTSRVGA